MMERGQLRTHTFTWHDPMISAAAARGMSGREYLEALRDGKLDPPPMVALMGMSLVEVGDGRVVFAAEAREYLYNGIGLVHGGFAATMLDSAIGCAAITAAPRDRMAVTLDLQVRYFKPITVKTGIVRCEGIVINIGRTTATAEGRMMDSSGRLYGHATSTLSLVPIPTSKP
jgi:uncharacterized protein (TIGR00369 family)